MNSDQDAELSQHTARLVSDCMWPCFAEPTLPLLQLLPCAEDAVDLVDFTAVDTKDPEVDSGIPSSPSTTSCHSWFSSESSFVAGVEWTEHSVMPSEIFPSCGVFPPLFNIWSPSSEDESILDLLGSSGTSRPFSRSSSPSPSTRSTSRSNSSSASLGWESDEVDWGEYMMWRPVPSLSEAEILLEQQKMEEEAIHARAAKKRAMKKAKYFARCKVLAQLRC